MVALADDETLRRGAVLNAARFAAALEQLLGDHVQRRDVMLPVRSTLELATSAACRCRGDARRARSPWRRRARTTRGTTPASSADPGRATLVTSSPTSSPMPGTYPTAKYREIALAGGKCTLCRRRRHRPNRKTCAKCSAANAETQAKRTSDRRDHELCAQCGDFSGSRYLCDDCDDAKKERRAHAGGAW
jgi:hypothetical protein